MVTLEKWPSESMPRISLRPNYFETRHALWPDLSGGCRLAHLSLLWLVGSIITLEMHCLCTSSCIFDCGIIRFHLFWIAPPAWNRLLHSHLHEGEDGGGLRSTGSVQTERLAPLGLECDILEVHAPGLSSRPAKTGKLHFWNRFLAASFVCQIGAFLWARKDRADGAFFGCSDRVS